MEKVKSPIVSLDVAKLVFAIFIPCLHIAQFMTPGIGYHFGQYLARLGVPFFFCCTGFLLQRRIKSLPEQSIAEVERKRIVLRQTIRIMKLFVLWEVIYLPISVVLHWNGDFVSSFMTWLHYQLFAADGALWFLLAMAEGLVLFWLIRGKARYSLAILFFACGLLLDTYAFLVPASLVSAYYSIFLSAKNGLFEAFPFLILGGLVADKSEQKIKLPAFGLSLCFALLMLEILLTKTFAPRNPNTNLYILIPFVLYYLFRVLLDKEHRFELKLKGVLEKSKKSGLSVSKVSLYLRKSSMGIYLTQVWVISICTAAAGYVSIFANGYLQWLLVLVVGFLFGYLSLKSKLIGYLF